MAVFRKLNLKVQGAAGSEPAAPFTSTLTDTDRLPVEALASVNCNVCRDASMIYEQEHGTFTRANSLLEFMSAADRLVIHFLNHVAAAESRFGRSARRINGRDYDA